ncbi:MAG TPA: WG repeat-containing protein [Actinocatenispora sp.]
MTADPEVALAALPWRLDPESLRELIDDREPIEAARAALSRELTVADSDAALARLYGLRSVAHRLLGELDAALDDGKRGVDYAEATGSLRRTAIARTRLAHAYQVAGQHAAADREYALALSLDLPERLRAAIHQQIGTCAFEQGRYIEACDHFEKALDLRRDADGEFMAALETALEAVLTQASRHGWGPYRRTQTDMLGNPPTPVCRRDTASGRWRYEQPDGTELIGPVFDEAMPFSDGKAWVRRAGALGRQVIDQHGQPLSRPLRFREVEPFSEGLAWVRADDAPDSWQAIAVDGRVVVPPAGYTDPRPFRYGVSVLRRGDLCGAVDRYGETAVPFDYDYFCTTTTDGRHIDGFTAERLAVVDRIGRRGVLDTTGRLIVPACYEDLQIHPVGFLIKLDDSVYPHPSDADKVRGEPGTWGALDRQGRLLVEPHQATRGGILDEIDGMLRDSRPVL